MAREAEPGRRETEGDVSEDSLQRLMALRARVVDVFARRGLSVEQFVVMPASDSSDVSRVQVTATLADGLAESGVDEFEEVLRSAHLADTELRAQRAQDSLREALHQDGGGFLPPPHPSGDS